MSILDNVVQNASKSKIIPICFLKSLSLLLEDFGSFKLFGSTKSSNLKQFSHINNIIHKGNVSISLFKLLNKLGIPISPYSRIYSTFVCHHFKYVCPVWHLGISREVIIYYLHKKGLTNNFQGPTINCLVFY